MGQILARGIIILYFRINSNALQFKDADFWFIRVYLKLSFHLSLLILGSRTSFHFMSFTKIVSVFLPAQVLHLKKKDS